MAFHFVHASDLHLDTPFGGLRRFDERLGTVLRESTLRAFDRVCDLAIEYDASFLLLAGDIYDGPERGLRAQRHLRDRLADLGSQGIRTFIVQGNHDPLRDGYSAIGALPEYVKIFPPHRSEPERFVAKDGTPIEVQGVSYAEKAERDDLSRYFLRPEEGRFGVGVLHASVGNHTAHEPYSPTTVAQLSSYGFDYIALGHIHGFEVLQPFGPAIVYSGNTQGLSPKPTERGIKGAVVVDVDDDLGLHIAHRPTSVVVFDLIELDLTSASNQNELRLALADHLEERDIPPEVEAQVVRVHARIAPDLDLTSAQVDALVGDLNGVSWDHGRGRTFVESLEIERPPMKVVDLERANVIYRALTEIAGSDAFLEEVKTLGSLDLRVDLADAAEDERPPLSPREVADASLSRIARALEMTGED
ncbi:MAG: metallophosphoesterase family protein [Acidimicrobiales bacterium]